MSDHKSLPVSFLGPLSEKDRQDVRHALRHHLIKPPEVAKRRRSHYSMPIDTSVKNAFKQTNQIHADNVQRVTESTMQMASENISQLSLSAPAQQTCVTMQEPIVINRLSHSQSEMKMPRTSISDAPAPAAVEAAAKETSRQKSFLAKSLARSLKNSSCRRQSIQLPIQQKVHGADESDSDTNSDGGKGECNDRCHIYRDHQAPCPRANPLLQHHCTPHEVATTKCTVRACEQHGRHVCRKSIKYRLKRLDSKKGSTSTDSNSSEPEENHFFRIRLPLNLEVTILEEEITPPSAHPDE